jgi:hypothetical protein
VSSKYGHCRARSHGVSAGAALERITGPQTAGNWAPIKVEWHPHTKPDRDENDAEAGCSRYRHR